MLTVVSLRDVAWSQATKCSQLRCSVPHVDTLASGPQKRETVVDPGAIEMPLHADTVAIVAGRADNGGALAPIVWASTSFEVANPKAAGRLASTPRTPRFYARHGNPSVRAFEDAVAQLDKLNDAVNQRVTMAHMLSGALEGIRVWGALGVGGTKLKIHKRAIQDLFTSNDKVLDAEEVLAIGRSLS